MIARLDWKGHLLEVDLSAGQPVVIPIDPHGEQAAFFIDKPARARPLRSGDYVGDIHQGGSCNAEVIELAPHCHGTHTECIGHIHPQRHTVQQTIYTGPVLARLVSCTGTRAAQSAENYPVLLQADELMMTRRELQEIIQDFQPMGIEALLIRTRPNGPDKLSRDYSSMPSYPVLSSEAMHWLSVQPLKHLLLDTPSLDRGDDQGRMANHHTWWGLDATVPENNTDATRRSVTEMIYVPDSIADGLYWLHIELSPLVSDATPSRPVLYPVETAQA